MFRCIDVYYTSILSLTVLSTIDTILDMARGSRNEHLVLRYISMRSFLSSMILSSVCSEWHQKVELVYVYPHNLSADFEVKYATYAVEALNI